MAPLGFAGPGRVVMTIYSNSDALAALLHALNTRRSTTNEKVQSGKARPSSLSIAVRLTVLPPPPAPPQGQPVDRLRNPAGEQKGVIACGGVAIVSTVLCLWPVERDCSMCRMGMGG